MSEPASEVGGDFYTYLLLPNGCIAFVIGDASGKGVAAALVMALTSSLVEAQAPRESGPGALLASLNAQLYPRLNASHSSVALLVAEVDQKTREMRVANAGMIAPLLVDGGECSYLPCYGPPLGIVPTANFVEHVVELQPNQMVVFTSDGIVEARSASGEMWGFERMEIAVRTGANRSPETVVDRIRAELAAFTADTEPADDMTIIVTQFTGAAVPA
jgi:serine phosphatase RsbU (regulator of sigma subunit)